MKKLLLVLLALALIGVIAALVFIRSLGESDPAKLLPSDILAFGCTPDLFQTAIRWPSTSLAKISEEPDVKEFLKKPASVLAASGKGGWNWKASLLSVKPRRTFFALTRVSSAGANFLVGFQFLGQRKSGEEMLNSLRSQFAPNTAASSYNRVRYNGYFIESVVHGHTSFYTTIAGHWAFLSNDLTDLQTVLNRIAGKNQSPSLAQNADYLQINAHLPAKPDLRIFINSKSALDALLAVGNSLGSVPDPNQVQKLRTLGPIGISCKLEGSNFRDTIALGLTQPPTFPPLQHIAMKFTHATTLGYLEMQRQGWGILGISLWGNKLFGFLTQTHFSLESFNQIFGSEMALFFSWPPANLRPPTILVSDIRNHAEAATWLKQIGFQLLPSHPPLPQTNFYQLKTPQYPIIAPTIAFYDELLFAGLTPADVTETLTSVGTSTTLENSPVFAAAIPSYRSQNIFFAFLNTKQLFERAYALLRPVIIFSSVLTPDLMQLMDTSKLPSAESISKHLRPIVATQQLQGNVMVFDSSGPITLDQALLGFLLAKAGMSSLSQP